MNSKRIVITGISVLAPNGIGKDEFWGSLAAGRSGIKPITLFDVSGKRVKLAGQINDFVPEKILGDKGLRTLDRTTKLALCAARLALQDAGYQIDSPEKEEETGVVLGTVLGIMESMINFDVTALQGGPRAVNPAHFPNTVINSPSSQISIWEKIKGFNTTISTGIASSLDALNYACGFLKMGRAKLILVGGAEGLSPQNLLGFYKIKALAGSRDGFPEICCPFDKRRNGIILGEAASIIALEDFEHAQARGAKIYAEVLGCGNSFDTFSRDHYNPKGTGMVKAIREALEDARVLPGEISYISASADSTLGGDVAEARAIKEVFGNENKIPVSAIKSQTGETFAAAGMLQLIEAINVLAKGTASPILNYTKVDARCSGLNFVLKPGKVKAEKTLINSFDPSGFCASAVIGKI